MNSQTTLPPFTQAQSTVDNRLISITSSPINNLTGLTSPSGLGNQTQPPGQTLPPGQTQPPGQTLQPGQTLPTGQTLQPGQTFIPAQSTTQRPLDLQIKDSFAKVNPIFFRLFNMAYPPLTTTLSSSLLADVISFTSSNDVNIIY